MFDITKLVLGILEIAVTAVILYAIPYIRAFGKEKLGEYKYNRIERLVVAGVKAAEQTYVGSGRGAEKKAAVIAFLREKGVTIDESELDAFIESAVYDIKSVFAA